MRYLLSILSCLLCCSSVLNGQNVSRSDAILNFLGVDDPQELDSYEVERLEHLMEFPVRVNLLSESELRGCGLFTPYQVAVLSDYIKRHGQVLSLTELALLDGFGESFVSKISPFISLNSHEVRNRVVRQDFAIRGGTRWQEEFDGSYGAKYRLEVGGSLTATVAASRPVGAEQWCPSYYTGSLGYKFRRVPLRVVAGDFNARFGQGLVMWSNSFLNILTTPDNFMKKPTGITQPFSFTGSNTLHGVATVIDIAKVQVSAIAAFEGMKIKPSVNVSWFGRYGQTSLTSTMSRTGVDAAFCLNGVNLFGEMAYDWLEKTPSVLLGTRFRTGERLDVAVQARAFLKDQYGASAVALYSLGQRGQIAFSTDAIYYPVSKDKDDPFSVQLKSQLSCELNLNSAWKVKFRVSERFRTWGLPLRTDVRTDVIYTWSPLVLTLRMNALDCDGTGYLSYLEGGYVAEKISLYLRQGFFLIDDWDDRIYVYERDAPGSFTSPAMYGRGLWTAMTTSVKLTNLLKFYVRASFIGYPFMEKKKPGKAELKLQLQYRF